MSRVRVGAAQPLDFLLNGGICESTERDDGTVPSKTEAEADVAGWETGEGLDL